MIDSALPAPVSKPLREELDRRGNLNVRVADYSLGIVHGSLWERKSVLNRQRVCHLTAKIPRTLVVGLT
jgi:hypothetical protein